jgi:hypothetical protein
MSSFGNVPWENWTTMSIAASAPFPDCTRSYHFLPVGFARIFESPLKRSGRTPCCPSGRRRRGSRAAATVSRAVFEDAVISCPWRNGMRPGVRACSRTRLRPSRSPCAGACRRSRGASESRARRRANTAAWRGTGSSRSSARACRCPSWSGPRPAVPHSCEPRCDHELNDSSHRGLLRSMPCETANRGDHAQRDGGRSRCRDRFAREIEPTSARRARVRRRERRRLRARTAR